jgi:hypothetical protein
MKSRHFTPDFAHCFVPESENDVIDRLGGLVAWNWDQQRAIGFLLRAVLQS